MATKTMKVEGVKGTFASAQSEVPAPALSKSRVAPVYLKGNHGGKENANQSVRTPSAKHFDDAKDRGSDIGNADMRKRPASRSAM